MKKNTNQNTEALVEEMIELYGDTPVELTFREVKEGIDIFFGLMGLTVELVNLIREESELKKHHRAYLHEEYKPKDKTVLRMSRDGAVEDNLTVGTSERISKRLEDAQLTKPRDDDAPIRPENADALPVGNTTATPPSVSELHAGSACYRAGLRHRCRA